jgi:putative transposase
MRRRFDHTLPLWVDPTATFFITICAQKRGLNHFCKPGIGDDALNAVRQYQEDRKWFCPIALLMPDHVHLLVIMSPEHDLTKTVGYWKRWLAKKHRIDWQENFFEHRVRNDESLESKARYIEGNPVRAGYVERPEDWRWVWFSGGY